MSIFEFVSVIISMVLALALSQLLLGVASLVKNRTRVRTYLPHTLWLISLFILPATLWWSLWDFRAVAWTFPTFGYLLLAPTFLFYSVALVVPDESALREGDLVDLKEHYYSIRHLIWMISLAYGVLTWFDGVILIGQEAFGPVGRSHVPGLVAAAVGLFWKSHRVQLVCSALQLGVLLYFVFVVRLLPGLGG